MTLNGIDVSTYQTATPPLAGLSFVFARASYGTAHDTRYAMHAANVRAAGLVLGAYHYWYLGDPAAQVTAFLAAAAGADLLALDLEGTDSGTSTAHAQIEDMIARIHSAGRRVGLYHSLSGYPHLGQDFDWVADWSATPPAIPWTFWQYRGGPLDLDHYAGDLAGLHALVSASYIGGGVMIYERTPETGKLTVAAGTTAHGLAAGDTWTTAKTAAGPATWHYDYRLHRIGGTLTPTYAYHMTDGPLAGLFVGSSGTITATPDPAPPATTPADVTAAYSAGYAEAKAAAIAAVEGI